MKNKVKIEFGYNATTRKFVNIKDFEKQEKRINYKNDLYSPECKKAKLKITKRENGKVFFSTYSKATPHESNCENNPVYKFQKTKKNNNVQYHSLESEIEKVLRKLIFDKEENTSDNISFGKVNLIRKNKNSIIQGNRKK